MPLNSQLSTLNSLDAYFAAGTAAGCPEEQMQNFYKAGIALQPRQLAAAAAARLCDRPHGPSEIGYGGARGGGKSFWLLAQMGVDDCQRVRGLKCLLLRKVGKANLEHFEDLRRTLFRALPHDFAAYRGILTFANDSRIIAGHFQSEKDIDAYLGLEYDVIGIEEATTLSWRKYEQIRTCCRSSRKFPDRSYWRPRIYSTTNPGGVGHAWYKRRFIDPHLSAPSTNKLSTLLTPVRHGPQLSTIFIPARVTDNPFANPEYKKVLESLTGWQRRAWLDGDWDIAAGQFFTTFRRDVHIVSDPPPSRDSGSMPLNSQISPAQQPSNSQLSSLNSQLVGNYFDESRAREWFASLDYGFTHYTVVLLGCKDADGNTFIVDEHAERLWLPERHATAIRAMLNRHNIALRGSTPLRSSHQTLNSLNASPARTSTLNRFVAGTDVFARQSDGTTVADQYRKQGIRLTPANMDRQNGWAEILSRLGDPANGVQPRLFIHKRCARLAETLPALQHDPNRPEDVLKVDADENGIGGDDAADALRYLLATKPITCGAAVA